MTDANDILELEHKLATAVSKLESLVSGVALARQVVEYDSDRRKKALAVITAPLLADNSSAAAETMARSKPEYAASMSQLAKEYQNAQKVLAEWECAKIQFDSARSLLSMCKATVQFQ